MAKLRNYQAWAKSSGTNDCYVTTVIKATSVKDAYQKFKDKGFEIQNKPYLSPQQF